MQAEILQRPSNTVVKLDMVKGEEVTTEGGSMVAMSAGLSVETTTHARGKGSMMKAMKRMITGESIFMNHFRCENEKASLFLAPVLNGDMIHQKITDKTLIVQGASYLASWGNVDLDMSYQGFKSLFAKEGMFWLKLSGTGDVVFNAFGSIYPVEVDGEYIVDTGHIVAFEDSLKFNLSKVSGGGWISSFLTGEGLVAKFQGKGTVWCQTHNSISFGSLLGPMLRPR